MLASNFKKQKKEKYYTCKETYNVKSKRAKNWICTWESHQSALGWNQFLRLHIMIFLLKSILIFLPLRFHGILHKDLFMKNRTRTVVTLVLFWFDFL